VNGHLLRPRAALEDDLRGIAAVRARLGTETPPADDVFTRIIAHRADRLLDDLLRHREAAP
jgi:hypothetical protein